MQALETDPTCPECLIRFLDAGDELVCPGCGAVSEKQVVEPQAGGKPRVHDYVKAPLGSYMGTREATPEERSSRGVSGSPSKYEYLKVVSDFAGRDDDSATACARLIERVGEKLMLPSVVQAEAASMAAKLLATVHSSRRITVAAVSAYSLISACRVAGVTSVSTREIIDSHVALGRRLSSSSIIQLSLESPIRTFARGPREYLPGVLARLSMSRLLADRLAKEGVHVSGYLNSLRRVGMDLFELVDGTELLGKRPRALAASAAYSAEVVLSVWEGRKRRMTQREAAECGDTSEYTVRDQCLDIFKPAVEKLLARRRLILPPALAH
jgi:transcription initiation factor TFIIIB Brf1 subunit/transcription initiation factor TFIIB